MPKLTAYPGVTLGRAKKAGYPLSLIWFHPLLNGGRVKRSIKTTDSSVQLEFAKKLSQLLRSPVDWNTKPEYVPHVLWNAWQGDIAQQATADAVDQVAGLATRQTQRMQSILQSIEAKEETPYVITKDALKYVELTAQKAIDEAAKQAIEIKNLRTQAAIDAATIFNLKARLRKLNANGIECLTPKSVEQAVSDYISGSDKGTNAGERFVQTLEPALRRLCRWLPKGTLVTDVTGQQVKQHLIELLDGKLIKKGRSAPTKKTVKKVARMINGFLIHQAGGAYDAATVKKWMKTNLHCEDEAENPYWLEQSDVDALLKHMPQFWRDVAELQWAGGFRPEELCNLMTSRVSMNGEIRVEVAKIKEGERTIWKAKTKSSYGKVHISDTYTPLLKRMIDRGDFLLIPNDPRLHHGVTSKLRDAFKASKKLWRAKSFCVQYLAQLRKAAVLASQNSEKIDSRTMRRSCGKRVLLASNLMTAAAVLRDTPKVVLAHYAKVIPSDVRQPEVKKYN